MHKICHTTGLQTFKQKCSVAEPNQFNAAPAPGEHNYEATAFASTLR
jgi:hypothetical protein